MTFRTPTPPLNHLRSFQVIGKHLSLARAAEELHLTASALSHQLGQLEDRLGTKLFARNGRGLQFTDVGRKLHARVDESLIALAAALREAAGPAQDKALVVSALHTFASRWLLPRFTRFPAQVANTEIRVSRVDANFDHDNVDCAVFYGDGQWRGLAADFLRDEYLVLVCAPAVLAQRPLARYDDVYGYQLLEAKQRPQDWELWLQKAGVTPDATPRLLTLESRNLVIEAAEAGLGLAVVDPEMVVKELESGRLVQPWPLTAKGPGAYYLVYPEERVLSGKVLAFRDWLLGEFAPGQSAPSGRNGT
ncbi:MAG: LysR substrate-binding domain-containing protein [Pseudomonadota bacterium]